MLRTMKKFIHLLNNQTMSLHKKLYLLLLLYFCYSPVLKAQNEMPIIAYYGVPQEYSTEANFQAFRECGFTASIFEYNSLQALVEACKVAEKCNIKIIGNCPEIHKQPLRAAQALKSEKGFGGYFLKDEPSAPEIQEAQKVIQQLKHADESHLFYINLLPYYYEQILDKTKTKTYSAYLQTASSTSCQQISFDYYPILTTGLRDTWYYNLEMIRNESLSVGKPFWGFVLSVPHTDYPQPTIGALRLQIFSNLAYGAQAIQYFTYWTPPSYGNFNFHDAPFSQDGKKTNTYRLVQMMNRELKPLAKLFYGAKVIAVNHLGVIPKNTYRQTVLPENIASLRIVGREGAVISQFEQNGHKYLAIVNKNYKDTMTVRIKAKNTTPRHLTKNLQEERMKTAYTVAAGDILLFKLK